MNSEYVVRQLNKQASAEYAEKMQGYFKTGQGQYGHGDVFWGLRMPVLRDAVKQFHTLALEHTLTLLVSKVHELRLFALLLLVKQYQTGPPASKRRIFDSYLAHTTYINSWDLVDCSAHLIVGPQLQSQARDTLYQLARSSLLWERRIAIMATLHFIRAKDYQDTLQLGAVLLNDPHDLIHKAVGWMLREVGNRNKPIEEAFLKTHYKVMPRTMLRYAIEKFPENERQAYLKGRM
ncbi:MAG: DNA alkylation repair protein [Paraglaciecola sp.]|nr:DNA alkylation repair protein [Paraglaciecola sp.]